MKRITAALAAIVMLGAGFAAYALNVDQTRTIPPRNLNIQASHTYRVAVNFNDPNIATAQLFGTLPANSFIDDVKCEVVTAFNAATTNVFTLGTTTTANELVNAGDLNEAATGVTQVTRGQGRSLTATADTGLYAKYTQTGTAATAGRVICAIKFIPDNDL